jgi:hypothetical protein
MSQILAKGTDIKFGIEFKSDLAQPAKPKIKFCVQIKDSCRFDRKSLDLAIGQRSKIFLLAGYSLNVYRDNSSVREYHHVAYTFERSEDALVIDKQISHQILALLIRDLM